MKRVLVLTILLAGLIALPGTAGAASWKGTVVAKDKARGAVVTVSKNGVARMIRARAALPKLRVGQRIRVNARRLANGTFSAKRVRVLGRNGNVRVRAVVLRSQGSRVLLSAGGSVFAVSSKSARRLSAKRNGLKPGARVLAHVRVKHGKLVAKWFKETGYANLVEIEGIYLSTVDGVLELAVVHRGRVMVSVPGELAVPELAPGDKISILARVAEDHTFSLVALKHGWGKGHHHEVGYDDDGKVKVYGTLSELTESTVSVTPGDDTSAVMCANPAGIALPGFELGMKVKMACKPGEDGELVVYELRFENEVAELKAKLKHHRGVYHYDEDDEENKYALVAYEAKGMLESLEPPTISLGEGLEPFSCTPHEERALEALTYDDEAEVAHEAHVGDKAKMKCMLDGDALVLVELETEHEHDHAHEYDHAHEHEHAHEDDDGHHHEH